MNCLLGLHENVRIIRHWHKKKYFIQVKNSEWKYGYENNK